jgi:small-conductance mechanosensitive channel
MRSSGLCEKRQEVTMIERFNLPAYVPSIEVDPANAALAAGAAVASFTILKVLLALSRRKLCEMSEEQAGHTWAEILKKTLASTSTFAVIATSLLIGLAVLDLPPPWNERVKHLWFIGLGVQLAMYLHRAIGIAATHYFRRHGTRDESETVAHTLVIWALQTAVWVVFVLAMLANLGINITTFIASLGIGGIAIALAVQNILGDLFASLSIAVDKPFEVGDSISVSGFSGTVEHVGLKTTRVRSDSGEQIVIANAELLKSTVRNFKRMSRRRVQFTLQASPQTPHALAAKVPDAMREIIERQPKVQFERAHLKTVCQGALEFDVVYYVLESSYALFMDTQQAVLLASMEAMERLGISTEAAPRHVMLQREAPAERYAPENIGRRALRHV